MNHIYQETVRAVEDGAKFKVDFTERSLKIDGKYIIRSGEHEDELGLKKCTSEEFFAKVEELYRYYKHSVPSQRSQSKSRQYFKALPESELDDEDMMYGSRRDKAQLELELFILCQILLGLEWNGELMGKWFWQSKQDKDLIILRQWIEPADAPNFNNKLQHEKNKK